MHETSLMNNLMKQLEDLAQQHRAKRIKGVKVKLGALSHFSKSHFREHFEIAARDSIAQGANLDIELLTDINDPQAQDVILDEISVETDVVTAPSSEERK